MKTITEYRSDSLNEKCGVITHYDSGCFIELNGFKKISQPKLKFIDTSNNKYFEIEGLSDLKKLKRLLEEYIELTENKMR